MNNKAYKAIKNFFHNELHLSKKDVKEIAERAIRDESKSQVKRYFQENPIDDKFVTDMVSKKVIDLLDGRNYSGRKDFLIKTIGEQILGKLKISLKDTDEMDKN